MLDPEWEKAVICVKWEAARAPSALQLDNNFLSWCCFVSCSLTTYSVPPHSTLTAQLLNAATCPWRWRWLLQQQPCPIGQWPGGAPAIANLPTRAAPPSWAAAPTGAGARGGGHSTATSAPLPLNTGAMGPRWSSCAAWMKHICSAQCMHKVCKKSAKHRIGIQEVCTA